MREGDEKRGAQQRQCVARPARQADCGAEAEGTGDACACAEEQRRCECACGGEGCGGDEARGGWAGRGVDVCVVGFVVAGCLKSVCGRVGDEVEAHEEEEYGHGKSCEELRARETERVANAGLCPNVEVCEDIGAGCKKGSRGVVEEEVGEGG